MAGWVKVDTKFISHPKVLDIGALGEALWLRGLCYAGDQLTDGFVPTSFLKRMGDIKATLIAQRLVESGLWSKVDDGYQIHDFLEWQRGRDEVEEINRKRVEAGRQGGKQKASNALANRLAQASDVAKHTPSKPPSNTVAALKEAELKTDTEAETPLPPRGGTSPDGTSPWRLLEALCGEIGTDPGVISERDKGKQLATAKRLIAGGATVDEIRQITKHLRDQSWLTGGIDLPLIEKQIGKWRLNGRPTGSTNGHGPLPDGYDLPPGISHEKLQELLVYDERGIALPEDYRHIVANYRAALNGQVGAAKGPLP